MPLYLDEDYMFNENKHKLKKKLHDENLAKFNIESSDSDKEDIY